MSTAKMRSWYNNVIVPCKFCNDGIDTVIISSVCVLFLYRCCSIVTDQRRLSLIILRRR